jgi:hypothetical protein
VDIIGVPNPEDGDDVDRQRFIDRMRTQIPHVLDDPGQLWVERGVHSQPTMLFVAADGSVESHVGLVYAQDLLARVEELAQS